MIKRIVKLTFEADKVDDFLEVFNATKTKIRAFDGCTHLELWNDVNEKNVFFTYSYWESEVALNNYRHSELFKNVWAKTKVLFADKTQAWSVSQITVVD